MILIKPKIKAAYQVGDTLVHKRFAWWPTYVNEGLVWLCKYEVQCEYKAVTFYYRAWDKIIPYPGYDWVVTKKCLPQKIES